MAMAVSGTRVLPRETGRARSLQGVRIWLFLLAALVILMVAVGGATRLTGSGLSITEWKPVTGALPPVSSEAWQAEFSRYQASPQYRLLNAGMSLGEFQFIYAWEWGHRQLGRLIGLVFIVPLLWFWTRGAVRGRFVAGLLGIGALGGAQAGIGWIMVASGLEPGMVAVAPVKLMLHLVCASVILALLVWTAFGLGRRGPADLPSSLRRGATVLMALVLAQIALGALVAGSKAGLTYNTWPLMDGRLVPSAETLLAVAPWWENIVDNPALVQFDHRMMGYAVVLFAVWHAARLQRLVPGMPAAWRGRVVAVLALAQVALGIGTLLLAVPLAAALAHQLLAMALLAAATAHARLSGLAEVAGPAGLPIGRPERGPTITNSPATPRSASEALQRA